MTASIAAEPAGATETFVPRILVFSTNTISDPGIDLAGSAHFHYSAGVNVIGLPCTSGIRPSWILHAFESGFDGVFIATDGEECSYLHDCAKRSNKIVQTAQKTLKEHGMDAGRIRVAAICSVCAEPFTKHMQNFSAALVAMGPAKAKAG
ncbi:MAG: hydrogenase iron-sulfur subunit [Chloroflexota bacterium]